jgi:hypothetical protein
MSQRCDRGAPAEDIEGRVSPVPQYQARLDWCNDARTGVPPGIPEGAMCVQKLDDSLNSAIHITYRISLRSSSMPEPRDPLLKVLIIFINLNRRMRCELEWSAGGAEAAPEATWCNHKGGRSGVSPHSVMIPPQVHLRRPCYDFYFL